ncbi:FIVAR domain-containing protein [Dorea sp. NSJ-36]|uniref:FIVAR domain-containing protein n=1 Tax=Dorea hominis TaxID=2763040 RepID=A0ABR7EVD7_9FIRM|nr:fibronectin type III domain-containing protein [Dorea hominis]MBC5665312.1 FIVAR domain-containing protein [Dorea hominis]
MGNKKRILAWILSLAMVFGLFAGQVSVAKAASLGIYKFELESDKLPSEGGELVVNIQFDDFATTDIPIYYQLKKAVGEYEYEVVEGYDNVEGQVVGNKLKINIPANKETKDVKYKLIVNLTSGKFETLWGTAETGAKRATFTVAAATGTEPGTPDTQKVLPDESHFRARAVDQNGNPVAGVKFDVKNSYNNLTPKSVTSDANGVVEIAIDQYDTDAAKTISLAENDKWECETTHSYTTYYYEGKIEKIDGQNLKDINEELVYVLKEKGAVEKADKAALKAAIDEATAIDTDKYSAGVEELKNALAEANTVYANEKATQTEVDAQVTKVKAAIAALVEKADKAALKAAIDEATAIDTNKYSAGVEELKSALAEANTVYANEKATQTEVDAQVKSLKAAISALVEKEPQPEPKPEPQPEVKKVGTVALKTTVYTYNGKVKKPAVVARNDKKKVISASDYTVKYAAGRKNVGKYSVTVTFKNGYKGKYTKTFTILPKGTKMSSVKAAKKAFTAKWAKQSVQTTGYQVQYSTSKNFKKSVKTATISKNKTVSKTVKKLKAKKTYYVRVRTYKTVKVNGKSVKLYSGWSSAKSVKTK